MEFKYETDRLILQCLTTEAAPEVLKFYQDNRIYFEPYELTRPSNFYTLGFQTTVLDWEWREMQSQHTLRYFLFLKQQPNRIIGTVNFSDIRLGCMQKASLGYKLDYRYLHRGYAYEACCACMDIAFRDYGLHRIEANILPSNQASIRLIKRLNFIYEGLEHEAAEINHRWEDLYRFARINPMSAPRSSNRNSRF